MAEVQPICALYSMCFRVIYPSHNILIVTMMEGEEDQKGMGCYL